jgi:hypothetical protein
MDYTSSHSFEFLVQEGKVSGFLKDIDDLKICISRLEKVNSRVMKLLNGGYCGVTGKLSTYKQ